MDNNLLIANAAVAAGIMTQEEVELCIAGGREIPLHTLQGWALRGYKVRKGEHGIETRLWKKKNRKGGNPNEKDGSAADPDGKAQFYLAKSYLFYKDQVIPAGEEDV